MKGVSFHPFLTNLKENIMKTKILILLLFISTLFYTETKAQNITSKLPEITKADTIPKIILDKAKYRAYYTLEFSNDTTLVQNRTQAQTILFIGSKYNSFMDYNAYRKDSVYDALVRKEAKSMEIMSEVMSFGKMAKFAPYILINYPNKNNYTFLQSIVSSEKYKYEDKNVKLNWNLDNEEKEIQGYRCKKATCDYRGRHYIAWYALDLPISSGPYVFSGLPGLILEISDSKQHYNFKINGFASVKKYDPIYIGTDKVVQSTRDNVRKAIYNSKADPASAIRSMGNVKVSQEALAKLKAKPYNPIELE